jgi:hypothetical protein
VLWQDQEMAILPSDELLAVFRAARHGATFQMEKFEATGQAWHEESITDLLLAVASDALAFVQFDKIEERATGADWLWWWVDRYGAAFGMLVQAKRLKKLPSAIGFRYLKSTQRQRLMETADEFKVAPAYVLYLGTSAFRDGWFCMADRGHANPCERCLQAAVSIVPALLTTAGGRSARDEMTMALSHAIPLEWLADPGIENRVWDLNIGIADGELQDFLLSPQEGARRVAKMMFERLSRVRTSQLSLAADQLQQTSDDTVFGEVPDDTGHFGVPYYEHVFRGLRPQAPRYVYDVLAGRPVPAEIQERVAGVVVFDAGRTRG